MAAASKLLAKLKPAAATPTTLYTVPAVTETLVNLFVANQGAGVSLIRVALLFSGGALAVTDYIMYDISMAVGTSINLTGIALATGQMIVIQSDTGDVSFVATGIEIT